MSRPRKPGRKKEGSRGGQYTGSRGGPATPLSPTERTDAVLRTRDAKAMPVICGHCGLLGAWILKSNKVVHHDSAGQVSGVCGVDESEKG